MIGFRLLRTCAARDDANAWKMIAMKLYLTYLAFLFSSLSCKGQKKVGSEHLKLEKEIQLPDVRGRIDHMAVNVREKIVYIAALGNNTVEVVDLSKGAVMHSIKGIEEPQGIAYIPEQNEIAVASGGNGDCIFFNASTFQQVATIHLSGDADNIRYDSTERKIYVGYGNGGMALIDPIVHKQTGDVKLSAHPESFQLDKKNNKLYVNLPNDHSIAIIDLKRFALADTWKIGQYRANYPMTLDTANNLVFVGYRKPALLVGYDSQTGKEKSNNELVGDVDDIFYYPGRNEIIASGGGGYINIFKTGSGSGFTQIANIPTREGARTALLISALQTFILAERATGSKNATIAVYTIND
jgi:DNA-binding beta-propeller fold protein YncE